MTIDPSVPDDVIISTFVMAAEEDLKAREKLWLLAMWGGFADQEAEPRLVECARTALRELLKKGVR